MKSRLAVWLVLGLAGVAVALVAVLAAAPKRSIPLLAAGPVPALARIIAKGSDPFANLTGLDNGPGVLVADPVPDAGVDSATAAFGTGCTRWLQFVVNNNGELGKTPPLSDITRALQQTGRTNWRLKPSDSSDMNLAASKLGVTHVVTSQIAGSGDNLTLSLQLEEVPSGKTVGAPSILSGAPERIVTALPDAAKTLLGCA